MIDQRTRVFGIIGSPLGHSLSPAVQNAAFSETSYNGVYAAFETNDAAGAAAAMRSLGIAGLSVTAPHKKAVMGHLDLIDPEARAVGAANTIVNREGVLIGCNTDARGALEALRRAGYEGGMRCLVAGAGGAARAAVFALIREGGEVFIVNRTPSRAEALGREFRCRALGMEELSGGLFDVVVQATSAGMHPRKDECSLPAEVLEGARIAMDMVYNPLETVFLSRARAAGAKAVDGLVMFVHQAAEQFRLWTGLAPPIECMDRTARKMIRGVNGD